MWAKSYSHFLDRIYDKKHSLKIAVYKETHYVCYPLPFASLKEITLV